MINDTEECFIDTSFATQSHHQGLKYIKKILKKYNETVDSITLDKLYFILNNFKTKYNKPLSYGSSKFIVSILTKTKNGWGDENFIEFKQKLKNDKYKVEVNPLTPQDEQAIKDACISALSIFTSNHSNKTLHETSLMVLLVLCTNFRISEVKQLTFNHLISLLNNETISIRIKKKLKPVSCIVNKEILGNIIETLKLQNRNVDNKILLGRSKVILNKTFKSLCKCNHDVKLGVQALRKVNTTQIIRHSTLEVAQIFNRHTNSQVTDKYYNTQSYVLANIDNVFANI